MVEMLQKKRIFFLRDQIIPGYRHPWDEGKPYLPDSGYPDNHQHIGEVGRMTYNGIWTTCDEFLTLRHAPRDRVLTSNSYAPSMKKAPGEEKAQSETLNKAETNNNTTVEV